ncbi:MFS transporter [Chloroflexota bacterium]
MKFTSTLSRFLDKVQTFDALRYHRNFRFLWTSNFLYQITWWMLLLVMSWLSYELTNSAFMVALFTAARLFPTLLGPFIGAIADRVNRRQLMLLMQALQVIFASTLAILTATGLLEFWHLAVIGFLDGLVFTAVYSTGYALAMDIVGERYITNAVALNVVATDITRIIGPLVGGVLIATLGAANCFWAATIACAFAIIPLLRLETPARIITTIEKSVWQDIVAGFKYTMRNRDMVSVLAVTFSANVFLWPAFHSFMPIFAKDNLGLGANGLGYLLATMGGGALIGAIILASMGNFKRKGLIYLWGTSLMAIFFGIFALSRSLPLALALVGLFGLTSSAFATLQATLMLTLAPEDMRGRSSGFLRLAIGIYTFGALGIGVLANAIGASLATSIFCGILFITILAMAAGMPNLRRL